ncbi:long-chain-fatty-acid--CoA ligase [Pelomonas sp. KK5]|uniref:long-chain-fatty-acid--CoA ligase n=1 Tax=Pelomonas sp. KK5 TaxID=1855730 RepID=UPI00097C8A6C|nr:long-chain-fatty-acid--CoA ligase [Pelomonas sp. KK5]
MELTEPLHRGARERPEAIALVCGARRVSYARLAERVARLAAALRAMGLQPCDRVALLGLNSDRYVECLFGSWWAGGVVNPVNTRWNPREIAYSLDDCETRILLVDDTFKAMAPELLRLSRSLRTLVYVGDGEPPAGMLGYEALLAAAAPAEDAHRGGDQLAAVMYTGGTTGQPKGVMLTHDNLALNARAAIAAAPRPAAGVGLCVAPIFHVGGCGLVLQLMARLARLVILPAFDEAALLDAIRAEGGSEIFLVPTMLKRLIEHPRFRAEDCATLELVLYGAAPIDAALLDQAMLALPRAAFCQMYGMTELAPVATVLPAACHQPAQRGERLRSAGLAIPTAELRIVDAEGRPVPTGTVGEVTVRGPTVMAGYWGKPEQTAQALREGWLHTGDGGRLDADGYLYIVDRIKDMIISGGENVYSAEVENVIAQMPQVSACAVVGLPDATWGERVHAVLVLRSGQALAAAAVTAFCRERIAGYKCPRSVEFRAELPLSAAGKVLKYVLRSSAA